MKLDEPDLQNQFVRLEILDESHRKLLAGTNAVQSMWQWMPVIATGTSFDSYFDYSLEMKSEDDFIPFAIFDRRDDSFAGVVAFADISRTHRRLRLASFWLREDLRGTVTGPAVQLVLIERAAASRMRRIEFVSPADNDRAIKSIERLGARHEGILRNYVRIASGVWSDVAVLSLVGDEIAASMALLRDRIREMQLA